MPVLGKGPGLLWGGGGQERHWVSSQEHKKFSQPWHPHTQRWPVRPDLCLLFTAATETTPVPGKAGRCPLGSAQEPLPSKLYCLSDESCLGGQKCCSLGRMMICVQPALVNPSYCPTACPTALEPCRVSCLEDAACGPGQKCCLQDCQLRCVVAEPARPGLCPRRRALPTGTPCRNQCDDDRGCPPGLKCCFSGCGLECLRPRAEVPGGCTDPPAPKCQDRCREDSDCSKEEICRPTACGFQCQGPPPGKPGVCPLLLRGSLGPCLDEMLKTCTHDFDCEEAKKCCSNGCRMVCRKPGEGQLALLGVKRP
ncbi:WAP four-disulfide core domain protein 3-like isoform X1 [Crotalus tigris]|uniref:WAP four-disulfide core domain protein 3-like isoform X1 n=1 Tax=Crotalus tigris TaxID=88082 RepID=UPI00192F775D|nr:WAP four-disulfide core domain protein 3-like isoform X1 [Crotalus tigris]